MLCRKHCWIAPLLLSAREAARALSVSERHLWGLTQPRGDVPAVRIGGRVLYSPDSLREWIQKQQAASLPAEGSER